jgi:mannose-6-phosphate isomerase-like protein (cupin superfamily)
MLHFKYLACASALIAITTGGLAQQAPAQPRSQPDKFPAPGSAAIYKSGGDLDAALQQALAQKMPLPLGPVQVTDRTSLNIVQRNSANGPIAHKGWAELHYIIDGSAVAEVGGTIKPGTEGDNAVVTGAVEKRVKKGDLVFVPGGSLHHYKEVDGHIRYYEIRFPDVAGPASPTPARGTPPPAAPAPGSIGIFFSGSELASALSKAAKVDSAEAVTPVLITDRFSVNEVMRGKPGAALAHPGWNEMQYILAGSGTMTTGGAITGTGAARMIQGGIGHPVMPGDVMIVPNGTPHQWTAVKPVTYLEVRFPDAPPSGP